MGKLSWCVLQSVMVKVSTQVTLNTNQYILALCIRELQQELHWQNTGAFVVNGLCVSWLWIVVYMIQNAGWFGTNDEVWPYGRWRVSNDDCAANRKTGMVWFLHSL